MVAVTAFDGKGFCNLRALQVRITPSLDHSGEISVLASYQQHSAGRGISHGGRAPLRLAAFASYMYHYQSTSVFEALCDGFCSCRSVRLSAFGNQTTVLPLTHVTRAPMSASVSQARYVSHCTYRSQRKFSIRTVF